MLEDWAEALRIRQDGEASQLYKEVDKTVEKIMRHSMSKESLTAYILTNAVNREIQREIYLREAKSVKEIKNIIDKFEKVDDCGRTETAALKVSYAQAVKSAPTWTETPRSSIRC
jgi:RNA polymerase-binding transcription factor DksA